MRRTIWIGSIIYARLRIRKYFQSPFPQMGLRKHRKYLSLLIKRPATKWAGLFDNCLLSFWPDLCLGRIVWLSRFGFAVCRFWFGLVLWLLIAFLFYRTLFARKTPKVERATFHSSLRLSRKAGQVLSIFFEKFLLEYPFIVYLCSAGWKSGNSSGS